MQDSCNQKIKMFLLCRSNSTKRLKDMKNYQYEIILKLFSWKLNSQINSLIFRIPALYRATPLSARLGHASSDASSQTDPARPLSDSSPSPLSRQLEEELECDKLSRDLASVLPANDRLQGILGKLQVLQPLHSWRTSPWSA